MTLKQLGAFVLAIFLMLLFFVSPNVKAHDNDTGWVDMYREMIEYAIEEDKFQCFRDTCIIVGCLDDLPSSMREYMSPKTEFGASRWGWLRSGTESTIVYYTRCSEI